MVYVYVTVINKKTKQKKSGMLFCRETLTIDELTKWVARNNKDALRIVKKENTVEAEFEYTYEKYYMKDKYNQNEKSE